MADCKMESEGLMGIGREYDRNIHDMLKCKTLLDTSLPVLS